MRVAALSPQNVDRDGIEALRLQKAKKVSKLRRGVAMWKSLNMGAALSVFLLFAVAACNQAPPPPRVKGPTPASLAWDKLTKGFIEDYMLAQPAFAARAGRHEFDGQLP